MTRETTALTWFTAARERAERAASKLRWLERDPDQRHADQLLCEATDELRAAVHHCEDSARSLARERAKA